MLTISGIPLKPRATLGKWTEINAKTRRVKVVTNGEPSLMQWWWTSTDGDGAQGGRTKELNYVKVALSGVWRLLLFFSSLTAE